MIHHYHPWFHGGLLALMLVCLAPSSQVSKHDEDEIHCPAVCGCGGVLDGRATEKPVPIYPDDAKKSGVVGTVIVFVIVDEQGRVSKAKACFGPLILRKAAEDAAYKAQIKPTKLSGTAVKVRGVLTYSFRKQEVPDPIAPKRRSSAARIPCPN